jgi:outer membrane receptor protein involved in Fe transport
MRLPLLPGLAFVALAALVAPLAGQAPAPVSPLSPVSITDELTVTATRTERRLADTPESVAVLSSAEIAASASPAVDDALRQVPGFTLFRRSGSRYANPTSQGVSLRGLGASGASRALVLADGVPLNDPFGGWVYWGRVPRASLDRIEVLRGAGSDLYGSAALGGVVQLLTRDAGRMRLVAEGSYAQRDTPEGSLFAAGHRGAWGASVAAESFHTGGYVLVEPGARGPVDMPASSRHDTAGVTLERTLAAGGRLFLRGSRFGESRGNGSPLQTNDTGVRQASAGTDRNALGGWLSLRVYAGSQDYHQTFSSISADRTSERLIRLQRVPADVRGGSAQGTWTLGARTALVAGLDVREVSGTSEEDVLSGATATHTAAEGKQRTGGAFAEALVSSGRASLTLGGRIDGWRNQGERRAGSAAAVPLPEREETAFSPRASLLVRASDRWAWTASAYRGFRAPTLNELYRAFRVGDVLTLANESLEAEKLSGAETGALWTAAGGRLSARGNLFWMEVDRTIANVTLSVAPGLITRQRRNLGRTRSRGLETELTARLGARWSLTGGYLLSDATVERAPQEPDLEGLRLAQVPRHQATFQLRFDDPAATAALQLRWTGEQFDDDLNALPLRAATTLDASVSRPLGHGISAFAAGENLLDARVEVGRTPATTVGPPRSFRIGFRIER